MLAIVAVAGLMSGGCGSQTGGPVTVPVRGVVMLDGKPLSSGVVQFQPASGQVATGEIAGDGSFTLSRTTPGDGVLPGTYSVAVVSYDPAAEVQSVENLRVPLKYTRFGSSGIEITVFPGTKEPLRIELESFLQCAREGLKPRVTGLAAADALDLALEITRRIEEADPRRAG